MWFKRFEVKKVDNGYQIHCCDEGPNANSEDKVFLSFKDVHDYFINHFREEFNQEMEYEVKS